LARIDPLSAVATVFLLSILLGIANIFAVVLVWLVARATGSLEALSGLFTELFGVGAAALDVTALLSLPRVIGIAVVFAIFQVVVVTVLSGVVAVLYNGIASLVGGIEVTLSDDLSG
jgi:E3 ubiquitin-protein ligase DOA10